MTIDKRTYGRPARTGLFCCFLMALLFWGLPAAAATLETISPRQAAALIDKERGSTDFVVLDLRTPAEFQSGHLEGAVMIDYYAPSFAEKLQQLDKSKTYLIYCRSGNRSGKALDLFKKLGFQSVYNMAQGINGWGRAGYAVTAAGK